MASNFGGFSPALVPGTSTSLSQDFNLRPSDHEAGIIGGAASTLVDSLLAKTGAQPLAWISNTQNSTGPPKISVVPHWYDVMGDSTKTLGVKLVGLVLTKQKYANYLMPMMITNEQNVQFKQQQFNPALATLIGPRGAWDIGSISSMTELAWLEDRAFGYVIQKPFLTATGQLFDMLAGYIQQIINIFADTMELLTFQALRLALGVIMRDVLQRKKLINSSSFWELWTESVSQWDGFRKDPQGQEGRFIFHALTKMVDRTRAIGGQDPDYVMCSRTVATFFTQHTEFQRFDASGPQGPEMLVSGPDGLRRINGKLLITPTLTNVSPRLIEGVLSNVSQVGDYNLPSPGNSLRGSFSTYNAKTLAYDSWGFEKLINNCWAFNKESSMDDQGDVFDISNIEGGGLEFLRHMTSKQYEDYMFHYPANDPSGFFGTSSYEDSWSQTNKKMRMDSADSMSMPRDLSESIKRTRRARVVGHLRQRDILRDQDLSDIVRSMHATLSPMVVDRFSMALTVIEEVVNEINSVPYGDASKAFLDAVFADPANAPKAPVANGINAPFAFGFKVVNGPQSTVPVIPKTFKDAAGADVNTSSLVQFPVGYQTRQGLKYIASLSPVDYPNWAPTIKKLSESISVFDEVATFLHRLSPTNKLLSASAVSSSVARPSLGDAVFENFVGSSVVPIYTKFSSNAKVAAQTAGALTADNFVAEMKIRAPGFLQTDATGATTFDTTLANFKKDRLLSDDYEWLKFIFVDLVESAKTTSFSTLDAAAIDAGVKAVRELAIAPGTTLNVATTGIWKKFKDVSGLQGSAGGFGTKFAKLSDGLFEVITDVKQKLGAVGKTVSVTTGELARTSLVAGADFVRGLWESISTANAGDPVTILPASPFNHNVPATRGLINPDAIAQFGAFGSYASFDTNTTGANVLRLLPFLMRSNGTLLHRAALVDLANVQEHLQKHHGASTTSDEIRAMTEILNNCWTKQGMTPQVKFVLDVCHIFSESTDLRQRYVHAFSQIGNTFERLLYLTAITTPLTRAAMKTWWRQGIYRPFTMGIFRQFGTFVMHDMITGKSGAETGYTLTRPFDWEMGYKLPDKDIIIGAMSSTGFLFIQRSNVHVRRDALLRSHVGGYDNSLLKPEHVYLAAEGKFPVSTKQDDAVGSAIVLILPRAYEETSALLLMVSDFSQTSYSRYYGLSDDQSSLVIPPSFALYSAVFGIQRHQKVLDRDSDIDAKSTFDTNVVLARGTTVNNMPDGTTVTIPGNGHLYHLTPEVGRNIAKLAA
jgi:hypothetical protein